MDNNNNNNNRERKIDGDSVLEEKMDGDSGISSDDDAESPPPPRRQQNKAVDGDDCATMTCSSTSSTFEAETEERESPPPRNLLDLESAVMTTTTHNDSMSVGRQQHPCFPFIEHSFPENPTNILRRGDLMFDGHEMTKVPAAPAGEDRPRDQVARRNNQRHHASSRQPATTTTTTTTVSAISLTPSLRAARPTPGGLRSSRARLSIPGAFRMSSRRGATSPNDDTTSETDSLEQPTSQSSSSSQNSTNFYTHNAHEVLIEATLVCDRSLATTNNNNDCDSESPPIQTRESYATNTTTTTNNSTANRPSFASDHAAAELVVEAKPLHGSSCCLFDRLGNWKAICFIILVIVAIAAVAGVIERYKPPVNQLGEPGEANAEIVDSATEPPSLPEDDTTTISLGPVEDWTEETFPTNAPSRSASPSTSPTFSPTGAPTSFLQGLPKLTQMIAVDVPESPQAMALEWIYQDPHFHYYNNVQLIQRFVLVALYYALDGPNWTNQDHWLSYDIHPCQWYSDVPIIIMDDHDRRVVCNEHGEYVELLLQSNELVGTLPPEFWLLSTLQTVTIFTQPKLSGTIPAVDDFGGYDANPIQDLILKDLALTGPLPTSLGTLQQLSLLELSKNNLNQTIPKQMGEMASLQYLFLDENELTGSLPTELGKLTALRGLYLDANQLTGRLPSQLGHNMKKAQDLFLNNNMFSDPIPVELFTSSSLQRLELHTNFLSGSLPTQVGLLTSTIQGIDLADNLLTGTLPSQLGLLRNLSTLLLESNSFVGTIPSELALLTKLSALTLHDSAMTGSVPVELCDLKQKQQLQQQQPGLYLSIDCDRVSCNCDCDCEFPSSSFPSLSLSKNENSGFR